ncbi:MAG: hypothetical protein HQL10_08355 [Nitrospirae bacterium]|nr:hypothetical protein [Nitrospirota bacterium]
MEKPKKNNTTAIIHSRENPDIIGSILKKHKNIAICGIQGVGKLTIIVEAVKNSEGVFFLENTFDYDGKIKERGYSKYIKYLLSLKNDMTIVSSFHELEQKQTSVKALIVDGIYGRNSDEIEALFRMLDNKNLIVMLIVRCIKDLAAMLRRFDIVVELTQDGALLLSIENAEHIAKVLNKRQQSDS